MQSQNQVGVTLRDAQFLADTIDADPAALGEAYRDDHGGNTLLRQRLNRFAHSDRPPLQASILETFGSSITEEQALARESLWKQKLGSRAHGLNAN